MEEGIAGGGGGGTQYRNTVRKIGKYWNTMLKIDEILRHHSYDRSRLLENVTVSRVCLSQACMHQQSTSAIAQKREKTSNWSVQPSKKLGHYMTLDSLLIFFNKYWPALDRRAKMNSTEIPWRIFFYRIPLPNTAHTAGLDDTAIPHIKIKISEIPLDKCSIPQYRKPPCPPRNADCMNANSLFNRRFRRRRPRILRSSNHNRYITFQWTSKARLSFRQ